jgi:hypothetical protein
MNPSLENPLTSFDPESLTSENSRREPSNQEADRSNAQPCVKIQNRLSLLPKAVAAAVKLPLPSTTMIQNPRKTLTQSSLVKVNQA